MNNTGEDKLDEAVSQKERQASTLGEEVQKGMLHAAGEWLKQHDNLDVYEARMAMWQRIHDALPTGTLQDLHGKTRGLAELDAHVADWSGRGKDFVWTLAKDVIAAEFPPVLLLPNKAPSIIDALSAQASGFIGEKAIRGSVAAYEGAKGAIGTVRGRIDTAMTSILSGSAMRLASAGGKA